MVMVIAIKFYETKTAPPIECQRMLLTSRSREFLQTRAFLAARDTSFFVFEMCSTALISKF